MRYVITKRRTIKKGCPENESMWLHLLRSVASHRRIRSKKLIQLESLKGRSLDHVNHTCSQVHAAEHVPPSMCSQGEFNGVLIVDSSFLEVLVFVEVLVCAEVLIAMPVFRRQ